MGSAPTTAIAGAKRFRRAVGDVRGAPVRTQGASPLTKGDQMVQLENIEAIEARLWRAADLLRSGSELASNEYFMPVMGLIFLRHAYSRFLAVKPEIEAKLPTRGGVKRALTKEDFSQKGSIFLRPEAQFDYFISKADDPKLPEIIIAAMEGIEEDYDNLKGVLPKQEYQSIPPDLLGDLIRTLNPEELKKVSGDVFGRIYEYFLTQFADQKAHDGGEFFTPISLVSFIANVLEPEHGTVFDPACGSGGMFVQSARVVERHHKNPSKQLTFRGLEKNKTTINLAKMNLAVHGLEGDIQQALTYYDFDVVLPLLKKCDYVMANPPFNVDEVDADKIKNDPRLPFGLPGVSTNGKNGGTKGKGRVQNANYLWIQYFYSYLNDHGRAGFVMSSQASSASRDEAKVREKLIKTGHVDIMVAIRGNFFYTRPVPCELWFLNKAKPKQHEDKVLMLDARGVYRKVTRKIYDFSPEQLQNLLSIVWLYRGENERFRALVASHLNRTKTEAAEVPALLNAFLGTIDALSKLTRPFLKTLPSDGAHREPEQEFDEALGVFRKDAKAFEAAIKGMPTPKEDEAGKALRTATEKSGPAAENSRDLVKQAEHVFKLLGRVLDVCEKELEARDHETWNTRDIWRARKICDEARHVLVGQLRLVRYFHRNAAWLVERFPDAVLVDVPGLVKLVDRKQIEKNDWTLSPGRYVGIAPEEVDEDFDFEETIRDIHAELEGLNEEAVELASTIVKNFKELIG
jgi:type I restriction enzyme M protein